jgi:H+/Cl- antiporter ClcA
MRTLPTQYTLGSLMIAIAIIAVALSFPVTAFVAIILLIGFGGSIGVVYAMIVFDFAVLQRVDRWLDARRVRQLRRQIDYTASAAGITFLEAESSGD